MNNLNRLGSIVCNSRFSFCLCAILFLLLSAFLSAASRPAEEENHTDREIAILRIDDVAFDGSGGIKLKASLLNVGKAPLFFWPDATKIALIEGAVFWKVKDSLAYRLRLPRETTNHPQFDIVELAPNQVCPLEARASWKEVPPLGYELVEWQTDRLSNSKVSIVDKIKPGSYGAQTEIRFLFFRENPKEKLAVNSEVILVKSSNVLWWDQH